MTRIPRRLRRSVTTAVAVAALLAGVSPALASAAPPPPPPPQGARQNPMNSASMQAWYADCGMVLDVASDGGVGADGYTGTWILKADPAPAPGAKQSNLDCTFRSQIRFLVKGGAPRTVTFNGNFRDVNTQRGGTSEGVPIRPDTATVVLCKPGGGCSGPLTARP